MTGVPHEAAELGVGHRMRVDHEGRDLLLVRRALLGVVVVTAHDEAPGRNLDHVLGHTNDVRRSDHDFVTRSGDRRVGRS